MALPVSAGMVDYLARECAQLFELQNVSCRRFYSTQQDVGHEGLIISVEAHPHGEKLAPSAQNTDSVIACRRITYSECLGMKPAKLLYIPS